MRHQKNKHVEIHTLFFHTAHVPHFGADVMARLHPDLGHAVGTDSAACLERGRFQQYLCSASIAPWLVSDDTFMACTGVDPSHDFFPASVYALAILATDHIERGTSMRSDALCTQPIRIFTHACGSMDGLARLRSPSPACICAHRTRKKTRLTVNALVCRRIVVDKPEHDSFRLSLAFILAVFCQYICRLSCREKNI